MLRAPIRNTERFDRLFTAYGELIHETCEALVPPASQPMAVFRSIVRELRKQASSPEAGYQRYERSWVFRIVAEKIRRTGRMESVKDPEHRTLFSSEVTDPRQRLARTQRYLLRLPVDARIALFLSRRHAFPESEIAAILQVPPDSLALTLRQATETLREWIWQDEDGAPSDPETESAISLALQQWSSRPLPEELKQTPLADASKAAGDRKSRWQRTPWYVRSGMEALALASVILAVVAVVPKARNIYERSLERQLDSFDVTEEELSGEDPSAAAAANPADEFNGAEGEDEEGAESAQEPSETADSTKVSVSGAQIWRFYIRTHSPAELRPLIVTALKGANVTPTTKDAKGANVSADVKSLEGVEAPGGIQFDVYVPTEVLQNLKSEIKKIASTGPEGSDTSMSGNFTWYVTKARGGKIPKGHARLVVWLYRYM